MITIEIWKLGTKFAAGDHIGTFDACAVPRKHELVLLNKQLWHVIDVVHMANPTSEADRDGRVLLLVLAEHGDMLRDILNHQVMPTQRQPYR